MWIRRIDQELYSIQTFSFAELEIPLKRFRTGEFTHLHLPMPQQLFQLLRMLARKVSSLSQIFI